MAITLRFHGATRTVTGSCYLLDTGSSRVLFDCGMFQGPKTIKELNYRPFPFDPLSLNALVLTHAHIDHTGLVPKLTKAGFAKPIYSTPATLDLCSVMLPDSGFIQESEVQQLNERNRRRGLPPVEAIYNAEDAHAALEHFQGVEYKNWFTPASGIRARYWNAGHLLGSASIEVEVEQAGKSPLRILFSGDIGPKYKLLEPDAEAPAGFDIVICESTYGNTDRFERDLTARRKILADEVSAAAKRQGALLIPSFAVERTQEVVTDLIALMESGAVPSASIFIDSPLANKATVIFSQYAKSMRNGDQLLHALHSPFIKATQSVDESKALARFSGFHIIVSASGMCDAGRIRHHLKNHLWQPSTTVLLVGFQAAGSLGRLLQDGARTVRIQGQEIEVHAAIRRIEDYSGHADAPELVQWLTERLPVRKTVFLTHGEEPPQIALAEAIAGKIIASDCIVRPRLDEAYELDVEGCAVQVGEARPRIPPDAVARLDWHNELAKLVLDINEDVKRAADEGSREAILGRLRSALDAAHPRESAVRPSGPPPPADAGSGTEPRGIDEG